MLSRTSGSGCPIRCSAFSPTSPGGARGTWSCRRCSRIRSTRPDRSSTRRRTTGSCSRPAPVRERRIFSASPGDLYDLLTYTGAPTRCVVHRVRPTALGKIAAATRPQRLSPIAGKHAGQGDPVSRTRAARRMRSWTIGPSESHRLPLEGLKCIEQPPSERSP
ncbi:fructose 1,6-bisphosphatase [Streptomyces sp. NBC_01549]|uniref:fructose 1,6-bisphosphatase n=1 Tax=Streptomyces sp. NBC_01549 TaxID=2975874 RepID=UPI00338F0A10